MLLSVLLLFVVVPAAVSGLELASKCPDTNKLQLCYNMYMQSFEITANPFPEYRAFKTIREMLLVEKGPAGQQEECNFQNALIKCLGALADPCITNMQFISTFNTSAQDAEFFVQDYYMQQFTCNAGFDDAMKYFYCMEQVGLYFTNNLVNCTLEEENSLSHGNGCRAYDNFISCLSVTFMKHCGTDIRNYICPMEVAGISHAVPQCAHRLQDCSKPVPTPYTVASEFVPRHGDDVMRAQGIHRQGYFVFP